MNARAIPRLEDRRITLLRTLDHIRAQQQEAESNIEWKDLRAQRRRSELLAELMGWYRKRLERVDEALARVASIKDLRRGERRHPL